MSRFEEYEWNLKRGMYPRQKAFGASYPPAPPPPPGRIRSFINPHMANIKASGREMLSHIRESYPRASRTLDAFKTYGQSSIHANGMKWMRDMSAGYLGKAFIGYSAYEGYQKGGISGAIGGAAEFMVHNYAFGAAVKGITQLSGGVLSGTGLGVLAIAGAAYSAANFASGGANPFEFMARPWVRDHMKKHAGVEMTRPVVDPFGTAATMRQRSVTAMQNSRINGRSAIGNEAALAYRPYFG